LSSILLEIPTEN